MHPLRKASRVENPQQHHDTYARRQPSRRDTQIQKQRHNRPAVHAVPTGPTRRAKRTSASLQPSRKLALPVQRYLPPPGKYTDQHTLPLGFAQDKRFHCWTKRHGDWRRCKKECHVCGFLNHESKICPQLYCSRSYWWERGVCEDLFGQFRPSETERNILVAEGVLQPFKSPKERVVPVDTHPIVVQFYAREGSLQLAPQSSSAAQPTPSKLETTITKDPTQQGVHAQVDYRSNSPAETLRQPPADMTTRNSGHAELAAKSTKGDASSRATTNGEIATPTQSKAVGHPTSPAQTTLQPGPLHSTALPQPESEAAEIQVRHHGTTERASLSYGSPSVSSPNSPASYAASSTAQGYMANKIVDGPLHTSLGAHRMSTTNLESQLRMLEEQVLGLKAQLVIRDRAIVQRDRENRNLEAENATLRAMLDAGNQYGPSTGSKRSRMDDDHDMTGE